jgi:hypothetical protein
MTGLAARRPWSKSSRNIARISGELAFGKHISEWSRESQSDPQTGPGGYSEMLLVRKCGWNPGKRLQLKIRIAAVLRELKEMSRRLSSRGAHLHTGAHAFCNSSPMADCSSARSFLASTVT